ncbi:MAG: prephenate dehydrogenase/arogenate dehydrogenase family protein [Gammaproteobacteria bacterium]
MIRRLAIIGVGLIGGSLALALRRARAVEEIVGAGRGRANLELARDCGIVDRYTTDLSAAVAGAEMVVIGASLGASEAILTAIAPHLAPDTVVTDVGSTKTSVVAAARRALGTRIANFIPGHPIAGTEHSGAAAAFAELYDGHKVILTPLAETDPSAHARVRAMWTAAGASVVDMPVELHDTVLAATSHLPHLLAYGLVDTLAAHAAADQIFAHAAGGFRDLTRVASSNPRMWTEIALANKAALLEISRAYMARLDTLVQALERDDAAFLEAVFTRAKAARDSCVVPESNRRE